MVKFVINDVKTGKSFQTEIEQNPAKGMKLGDKLEGGPLGLSGYEFEITGGSDNCGFPLRRDVVSTTRKKPLFVKGTGLRHNRKGDRKRKTVAPNIVKESTSQLNLKVLKYGSKNLQETFGKKEEGEAPKEESPKKEKKPKEEKAPKEEKK